MKNYKNLGWMNSWTSMKPEYTKCRELKHEVEHSGDRRGIENKVVCHKCKIYWKYDSSD